jgi:hypothetical protein
MENREVNIPGITLPPSCRMLQFAEDLLLVGVNLTQERYNEIKSTFPADIQAALIGWKLVAQ